MPYSRHMRHTSEKQRRRQQAYHDDALIPHGREGTNAQVVTVNVPEPWSHWIPGENGTYFYQARMKADGNDWEYRFTYGIPVADPGNPSGSTFMAPNIYPPVSVPGQQQASPGNTGNGGVVTGQQGATPSSVSHQANYSPSSHDQSQSIVTIQTLPEYELRRSKGSRMQGHSCRGSEVMGGRKKKLSSVVKAEKELKFNPKKSVKSWLNDVDP